MTDNNQLNAEAAAIAQHFVAETGGLPEITAAASSLKAAIEQTRREIEDAEFATSRFPSHTSDNFNVMSEHTPLSQVTKGQIALEGEAGLKRASLGARLDQAEAMLGTLIGDLVELRTDLVVSQNEF